MDRLQALTTLMKEKKLKNYLEIGVFNGHIFFRIRSSFKVAVDPDFRFDTPRRIGKTLLNPCNLFNRYYQKTSDSFFEQDAPKLFEGKKIDLALIDGMHEYAFALRDAENTLQYLDEGGVIIMHDCNPQREEEACSFREWKERGFAGVWNGDVWKTIVYLRSARRDLDLFVLDCDHGLGVITQRKPADPLLINPSVVENLSYGELERNRKEWLNLQPPGYFYDYFGLK